MERDWTHYSFMVLFKSYLSCYLNPESLLWFDFAWSVLYRLMQWSGRGKTPKVALVPGIPFSYCLWCSVCLSLVQLSVYICFLLFHLPAQMQRLPDMSCGHGVVDTFLGRQEEVVNDIPGSTSNMALWTHLFLCEGLPTWAYSTKQRKNTRYSSKRDFEDYTKEKLLFLQNKGVTLATLTPSPALPSPLCNAHPWPLCPP